MIKEIEDLVAVIERLVGAWEALHSHLTSNPPGPPLNLTSIIESTGKLAAVAEAMRGFVPAPSELPPGS